MPTWFWYLIFSVAILLIVWLFSDGQPIDAKIDDIFPEFCETEEESPEKPLRFDYSLLPPPTTLTNDSRESKGERACRDAVEDIFGKEFPSVRPGWLINPETGYPLELDCYNADLKLAIEFQGSQHYEFPNRYHKTVEE
ncbi:MAG: hypothetical protein AAB966_01895, partial [Patescibacteria group bacterium]